MYIYQESTYYFDDFKVEEKVTKKIKVEDLGEAFTRVDVWIADHKDDVFPEECCDDEIVDICTYLDDDIQYCVKILRFEPSHENQSV